MSKNDLTLKELLDILNNSLFTDCEEHGKYKPNCCDEQFIDHVDMSYKSFKNLIKQIVRRAKYERE